MSKKCKGCGVELQYENADKLGYTPKQDSDYCQRCFRLTHYNDEMISMQQGIDNTIVLKEINDKKALILWVVDLFDFEGSIIKGLNRHLTNPNIILVLTKRDLLPKSIGNQKIIEFVIRRLKSYGIEVLGAIIVGDLVKNAYQQDNYSLSEIDRAIELYRKPDEDVIVMGVANTGKSTLLNAFLGEKRLTVSSHPGTSLALNPIAMNGYTLYDTPGLVKNSSLLTSINSKDLKIVVPRVRIKPKQYQLNGDQSLAFGGLARIDILGCDKVSVTTYFSNELMIHRTKVQNADNLWEKHLGELLKPAINQNFKEFNYYEIKKQPGKLDVVINGLGWICVSGNYQKIEAYVDNHSEIIFRKGMI